MEVLIVIVVAVFAFGYLSGKKKREGASNVYAPQKKKGGCIGKTITAFFGLMIVAALISSVGNPDAGESTVPASTHEETSTTEAPTEAPKPTATPEPTTLQEWAESVAQSVYLPYDYQYTNLISVSCEQVDGESAPMIIINVKYPSTFMRNNDERMSGFLFNVMNVNWKFADLAKEGKIEYGSVYIHGRTTYLDKYGNEIEGDAASIRIKASEAAKVNWSMSTVNAEMMPGIAVSFMIHPIIRDGLSAEYLNKIR